MSAMLTLDDLAVPLRVLRLLAAEFGHLAAPSVQVSTIYPNQLDLTFHDDLPGFEEWRAALEIAPDAVTYGEQAHRTRVLNASVEYAGAVVELTGFADIVAPVAAGGAA
ncbi:hypothetical protein [Streptomyces sp. NPDC017941]|uniref:hypothetical protein n=1 Tax=Streptomyces sp. NPDC017941 TaxID=3365018 RepID=UPI0037B216CE